MGGDGSSTILTLPGTQVGSYFGIMQRETSIQGPDDEVFRPERELRGICNRGRLMCRFWAGDGLSGAANEFVVARSVGKFERIVNRDPVGEVVEDAMFSLQRLSKDLWGRRRRSSRFWWRSGFDARCRWAIGGIRFGERLEEVLHINNGTSLAMNLLYHIHQLWLKRSSMECVIIDYATKWTENTRLGPDSAAVATC